LKAFSYESNLYGNQTKSKHPHYIQKKKKNKNQNLSFLYVISPNLNAQFMRKTKNYTKIENVA